MKGRHKTCTLSEEVLDEAKDEVWNTEDWQLAVFSVEHGG